MALPFKIPHRALLAHQIMCPVWGAVSSRPPAAAGERPVGQGPRPEGAMLSESLSPEHRLSAQQQPRSRCGIISSSVAALGD